MKVWLVQAKLLPRKRMGVRVFAKKEDAIAALNKLRSSESYKDKNNFEEVIVEEGEGFHRLIECDLAGFELNEVAVATELTVE